MLKTYEINLDIEKELYSPSNLLFSVSNNDFETIELTFLISQDEVSLNLLGTTVDLAIKKPSGLTVYQNCEIVDAFEGTAKVMISNQAYNEYGIHTAEIYVRTIDQLAVTCPFWFMSRAAIMDDETILSENDWSAFQVALFNYDLKPIITEGFPIATPEYIGQMAFDSLNKIAYIANDLTSVSWQTIGTGEGGGGGNDTILGIIPPAIIPARIGQVFIDTVGKAAYISTGATAADWEQIDGGGLAAVTWDDVTEKPTVFPADTTEATLVALFDDKADADHDHTAVDITDFGTEVNGLITTALSTYTPTIPTEYLTETEGNTNYAPKTHNHDLAYAPIDHDHTAVDITDFGTEVNGLITTALTNYVPTIPTEYLTETEGNTNYAPKTHNHDLAYAPIDHDHTAVDITDFGTEVNGLITTALSTYTPTIPTEYLTETEGNTNYAPKTHNHDTEYYKKTETYSALEVNDIVDGITQGGGTTVTDNLLSFSTTAALSANQGRVLKAEVDGKAAADHDHTAADISDFGTEVGGLISTALTNYVPTIPTEYLTETEGNTNYALKTHNHDLAYAPIDHDHTAVDITDFGTEVNGLITTALTNYVPAIPAEYLTETEGNTNYALKTHNHDLAYAPIDHDHTAVDITDFGTEVNGLITTALTNYVPAIPTEYLTETEGNTNYALKTHNHDLAYAPIDHDHTAVDITDFGTEVNGLITTALTNYVPAIPAEYLTETEGNTNYALKTHNHDLAYAPIDHDHTAVDITDFGTEVNGLITTALTNYVPAIPAEYLTETEGNTNYALKTHNHDLAYAPIDHDHTAVDITDFGTEVNGLITTALTNYVPAIPAEYLTETEGNTAYQPKTTTVAAPPVSVPTFVGQTVIDTTNDFPYIAVGTTAPDWKRIATTGYADAADNIILGKLGGLSFWSGTQAAYDLLTPNATTVYFITG